MNASFPLGTKELRIGMIGMTEGNGHPYSWSAMFNHYDAERMRKCPFPTIPNYLDKQPTHTLGIDRARVTHIWCDRAEDARDVAACTYIDHVVKAPVDMIGEIDAVIIATDIGSEHVERSRPFIEAGIPLLIDKPLADTIEDLAVFVNWHNEGARFVSSSSMRYTKELEPYHQHHYELGRLMYVCQPMCKKWETYGIHALEAIYPILGPGFESICNTGDEKRNMVHIKHKSGCDVHIPLSEGMYGAFGHTLLIGSDSSVAVKSQDSYYAFKKQLDRFVHWLRTGQPPQPFEHTIELIKMVIGASMSREQHGRSIRLDDIQVREMRREK